MWFLVLALARARPIRDDFGILAAFNPYYAVYFLFHAGYVGIVVLGAVFLTVTGAEALYADLGHFGRKPIQWAWICLVFPALTLNYLGQGALVLKHPEAMSDPFYPDVSGMGAVAGRYPRDCATIIASQAVITGAFS